MIDPWGILGIVVLILDVIAIFSVLGGSGPVGRKVLWVVLILLLPVIGMILYYLVGRNSRDARL